MSSIQAGLFPDKVLLVVQGGVYLAALVVSHVLIVKPALRISAERRRRTSGKMEEVATLNADAATAEQRWHAAMRTATDEARRLRGDEVAQGQAEAQRILQQVADANRARLAAVRDDVDRALQGERARLPELVEDVVKSIWTKLGVASALLLAAGLSWPGGVAHGAEGGAPAVTMDNFVWPYFQFILFALVVGYALKRILPPLLQARRERLKGELAEARAALKVAEDRAKLLSDKLATVERESADLRDRFLVEGKRERANVISDAQKLSEQMKSDTERVVRETLAQGREKLRRELLDLAIQTVEQRLTGDKLEALDVQLKKSALETIEAAPSAGGRS